MGIKNAGDTRNIVHIYLILRIHRLVEIRNA